MIHPLRFFLLMLSVTFLSCSYSSTYVVKVGNVGKYGVIIYNFPVKESPDRMKIESGKRGGTHAGRRFDAINNHYLSPPQELTLTWQLAELKNCSRTKPVFNKPGYFSKHDCEWVPLPDKIITKTINLRDAKKSKAFKEKGRFDGLFSSRRKAALIIDIDDENVIVSTIDWSDNKLASTESNNAKVFFSKVD